MKSFIDWKTYIFKIFASELCPHIFESHEIHNSSISLLDNFETVFSFKKSSVLKQGWFVRSIYARTCVYCKKNQTKTNVVIDTYSVFFL